MITTVAGDGTADYSGDNGPATAAELNAPAGIAVDSAGDLFIADTDNSVIREVASGTLVTVSPVSTTTNVVAAPSPASSGESVTLTATVGAVAPGSGTPTGTVTFSQGSTTLGTGTLDSGTATLSTSTLAVGNDTITASYSGATNFAASSGTVTEPVGTTTTTLTASPTTAAFGQSVTLTATVSPTSGSGTPGGTVTFRHGSTTLGTATLDSGTATLSTSTLAVGSDSLTATYGGDATFAGSSTMIGPNSLMTTVAGNGTPSYSGDGGQATAAELSSPADVAVDSAGDLFIADTANNVIREVNASTGVITTVAGNGTAGYSGDNGQATAAELNAPTGIAVDSAGDLFIADTGNNVIREVNLTTGMITTVAGNGTAGYSGDGGQATAAELNAPRGRRGGLRRRPVHRRHRQQRDPRGECLPRGVITTVAGNGTTGYSGDGGPATAAELNAPDGRRGGLGRRPLHRRHRQQRDPRGERLHAA